MVEPLERIVRFAFVPLLGVLVVSAFGTVPAAWSAEEDEEEVALRSETDYLSVSSLVSRDEMSKTVRLLSERYQSRVTGYPDAGLVLAPRGTPALQDFYSLARQYHQRLRSAALEIWANLQTQSKRLPSEKEVQEHYGKLPTLAAIVSDIDGALRHYQRKHPMSRPVRRHTAEEKLVRMTLEGSCTDLEDGVRVAADALKACERAKGGRLDARREALQAMKKAIAKLDELLDMPGDRFDSLSSYLSSFKQLAPNDLQDMHRAGRLGAAGYVYAQFRMLGLDDVDIEPFDVVIPINAGARAADELDAELVIEDTGKSYPIYPMWPNLVRTPKTVPAGMVGRLSYAGRSDLRSYNGLDLTNAIVMLDFDSGSRWFNAPLLGARAVLFIEPERTIRGEAENKFLSIPVDLPRFWVPKDVADRLLALLKLRGDVRIRLKCNVVWETRPAYNIIGRLTGTDQRLNKQQVIIQSYYDSISITPSHAPGAESATNLAALLQVADTFVHHRPKRSVLFLATGGHFQGLAGSKQFITKRKRGARTDSRVRRLFELADDSRNELEEAADRVWEEERARKVDERKSAAERAEEQIKALGRVGKALRTVRKNVRRYRKTVDVALREDPNKKRPEEKLFSDVELTERARLLQEVFEPRVAVMNRAMDALERELQEADGLVRDATVDERTEQLDSAKAAVDALADALDFSEEGISLWFSIDLSSHNGTFGIFYKGNFYNYSENIQWKFSDIGKKAREYAALIGTALAVDPKKALVDGINAIQGKDWRVYMGGKLALDSEVATLAAIPGLAFATIDDQRHLVDTPLDVWEAVDIANAHRQVRFLACLLHDLVSISKPKDLYRLDLDDNFCEVYGHLVEFDPKTSYFPDEPIPGAVAVARAHFKTAMGVRCEVMDQVGNDGKLSLLGLPNTRAVRGNVRIEGYYLDPVDGHVSYAPDLGRTGDKTYPIEIPMDMMEKPVSVVMFECLGMTIFDMVDQRFFTFLSEMHVYDAASEAEPQEFGTCLPLPPQQWVSYYEPVAVVYARPGTRLKVTMGASVLGLRFVLLNATDENWAEGRKHTKDCLRAAEGRGYLVDDHLSIPATPYRAAWDMWKVDDHRAGVLADKGVRNSRIEGLHASAKEYLDRAGYWLQRKEYDRFLVNARRAWSYESRAYPDVRKTSTDVVKGIIFYLALLLPFSYFAERLLIAARSIKWQIVGWFGIFLGIFTLIGFVHPAFAITFTPAIILLAFVILTLTAIVVGIIVGKFEEQMKQVKYEQTGIHSADMGRLSASSAAFSLGISNMRRRKVRTILTCGTLVLLTFTVLSFTSVVQGVRINRIYLPKQAPYNGILIRDKTWNALSEPMTRIITNEFGRQYAVAPRAWFLAAQVGQQSFLNVYRGPDTVYAATAMVGLTPQEQEVLRPSEKLEAGRWLEPGDEKVCLLPKRMAEKLGVTKSDVGTATVQVFGVPLRVIGLISTSRFKKLVDLDGEQLTPVDYLLMQEQQQEQQQQPMSEDELREYIHLDPDQVLIVPYEFAVNTGATLRSIAIGGFESGAEVRQKLDDLMRRVELNLYSGEDGKTFLCSAVGGTSFRGMRDLGIPIVIAALIVLNTMLGSVYERTKEIGIYSSLGLAPIHIAMLFVAEACVYAILGAIAGYLLGQVTSKVLTVTQWGFMQSLNLNYSSLSAVGTTLIVMATVLLSTLYPAKRASEIAVPGIERRWRLPDPADDVIHMQLPFTVTGDQALGVNMFLHEYLEAHADYSLGHFSTGDIRLRTYEAERGTSYDLSLMVWLAPYDLGVSERLSILTVPGEDEEVFEIALHMQRESGDESSWIRVTRNFVNMLRKQYLLWRTFPVGLKAEYGERAKELIEAGAKKAPVEEAGS